MTIKVKIILDLEQGEVELTKEEARQVYETLKPFFVFETNSPPLNPLFQYPPGVRGVAYEFNPNTPKTSIDNGNPLTGAKTFPDPIYPFGTK